MKVRVFLIFLACLPLALKAQISFSYRAGYGTYAMKRLGEYQEYMLQNCGLPAKIVTQFPGYINHRLLIGFPSRSKRLKVYLGYLSTGGRISLSDYSGKYRIDMELSGFQAGIHFDLPGEQFDHFDLQPYIDLGSTTTLLRIKQSLIIAEQEQSESLLFAGHGADIQPGLVMSYKCPRYSIGAFFAYEKHVAMAFYEKGSPGVKLGISSDNLAVPDWSGIRGGIELCYVLGRLPATLPVQKSPAF